MKVLVLSLVVSRLKLQAFLQREIMMKMLLNGAETRMDAWGALCMQIFQQLSAISCLRRRRNYLLARLVLNKFLQQLVAWVERNWSIGRIWLVVRNWEIWCWIMWLWMIFLRLRTWWIVLWLSLFILLRTIVDTADLVKSWFVTGYTLYFSRPDPKLVKQIIQIGSRLWRESLLRSFGKLVRLKFRLLNLWELGR